MQIRGPPMRGIAVRGAMVCSPFPYAGVAELADAPVLGTGGVPLVRITPRASSILAARTTILHVYCPACNFLLDATIALSIKFNHEKA